MTQGPESIEPKDTNAAKEAAEKEGIKKAYEQLSQQAPTRQVEAVDGQPPGDGKRTFSEATVSTEDLTDMQAAMKTLFPSTIDYNSMMISRVDPAILLSLLHLMSVDEIMRADPKKPIDVNAIYMANYVRLTVGLDGKGRVDTFTLAGAAREEKKAEKMLGAGGI